VSLNRVHVWLAHPHHCGRTLGDLGGHAGGFFAASLASLSQLLGELRRFRIMLCRVGRREFANAGRIGRKHSRRCRNFVRGQLAVRFVNSTSRIAFG
jgi:hypothetical protein